MPNLKKVLASHLHNAERIAVIGVGSELRNDDVAGILIAKKIGRCRKKLRRSRLKIFIGGTAPENLTGEVIKFNPTHILIIDSADLNTKPGTAVILDPVRVGGVSFSTHMMPLKMMVDYLEQSLKCRIIIIGIQPQNIKFGGKISRRVESAINSVSSAICESIA